MQPPPLQSQISAQILDHIRTLNMRAGKRLKDQAPADTFRVSRAPTKLLSNDIGSSSRELSHSS